MKAVSYTHLDVYKRQGEEGGDFGKEFGYILSLVLIYMFKKKEQKSVVEQLKGELGTGFEGTYMGMMFGYGGLDEDTGERREDFVEILEPFIEDKLEKEDVYK